MLRYQLLVALPMTSRIDLAYAPFGHQLRRRRAFRNVIMVQAQRDLTTMSWIVTKVCIRLRII